MMSIRCPRCGNDQRFACIAHISQEWVVDGSGSFVEVIEECVDIVHKPDRYDLYECLECGEMAKAEDEESSRLVPAVGGGWGGHRYH